MAWLVTLPTPALEPRPSLLTRAPCSRVLPPPSPNCEHRLSPVVSTVTTPQLGMVHTSPTADNKPAPRPDFLTLSWVVVFRARSSPEHDSRRKAGTEQHTNFHPALYLSCSFISPTTLHLVCQIRPSASAPRLLVSDPAGRRQTFPKNLAKLHGEINHTLPNLDLAECNIPVINKRTTGLAQPDQLQRQTPRNKASSLVNHQRWSRQPTPALAVQSVAGLLSSRLSSLGGVFLLLSFVDGRPVRVISRSPRLDTAGVLAAALRSPLKGLLGLVAGIGLLEAGDFLAGLLDRLRECSQENLGCG